MWMRTGRIVSTAAVWGLVSFGGFVGTAAADSAIIKSVEPESIREIPLHRSTVKPDQGKTDERAVYLIRLRDAPIATYRGEIKGLEATAPEATGTAKLDAASPRVVKYKSYLMARHRTLEKAIGRTIGRPAKIVHEYYYGNNGIAVWLTPAEAEKIKRLPSVDFIQRDIQRELHTDAGPAWIGAPDVWNGSAFAPNQGEGVVVGIIDTGINPSNPSFADIGGDGYDHDNPRGAGNYVGICDNADPSFDASFPCNDKLIGARGYDTGDSNGTDPRDSDGHGSHTASTAAGNHVDAEIVAPTITVPASISGVAPHANIIAYAGCCSLSGLTAAIDDAIEDGVDVINYSIGSPAPSRVWSDFDAVGFLNARAAGIFVATSAGNGGPGARTLGSPADAPWLTAVGASTHDRAFLVSLASMSGGDTAAPADMLGQSLTSGYGPAPIVHAKNYAGNDPLCLNPYPAGTWTNEIVVCDRGEIARVDKSANVAAGGAKGFVLANTDEQGESVNMDPHSIPAIHIGDQNGDVLRAWLDSGTGHMATISGTTKVVGDALADIMAGFSSRGGNRALPDIIKPDVAAPGVGIVAAVGIDDPAPAAWGLLSGTSMASPHVAGAGALLKALHPDWTPAEMQSALMTTAVTTSVRKEDAVTPADPFDMGGGVVDLGAVAANTVGLVLDETKVNYVAADPSTGGDPKQLNLPSFGNNVCAGSCSWTRTVRSVAGTTLDWVTAVTNPPGWELSVSPATFSIMPGATQQITVTARAVALPSPDWSFGQVMLTPSSGSVQAFPVALSFNPPPSKPGGSYVVTNSVDDSSCDTGFGGYLDLASLSTPLLPYSALNGDSRLWSAFSGQNPIDFYGIEYTGLAFSDDGFVMFDWENNYGGSVYIPQTMPDAQLPNNLVAMLWSDLEILYDDGSSSGQISGITLAAAGDDISIIEYDDPVLWNTSASVGDFEIVIHSTVDDSPGKPEIVIAFDNLNPAALPDLATIGVESIGGLAADAYLNNEDPSVLGDGLMVCFDYQDHPGNCMDYWVLDDRTVFAEASYEARKAIFAGKNFTVETGDSLALQTVAGGSVSLFPGFALAVGASLRVTVDAAGVCPL
ncbi:S8 family peptidase [Thiolapillus sp.]